MMNNIEMDRWWQTLEAEYGDILGNLPSSMLDSGSDHIKNRQKVINEFRGRMATGSYKGIPLRDGIEMIPSYILEGDFIPAVITTLPLLLVLTLQL
jgi:hypothetical protein